MTSDVIFQFPTEDMRDEILAHYNAEEKLRRDKMLKKTLILCAVYVGLIFCVFISTVISMLGVLALFLLTLSTRQTLKSIHLTEILATRDCMILTVHRMRADTKRYTIPYDAITAATINDKYDTVTIMVKETLCSVENLSRNSEVKSSTPLLSFQLNSYSAEQGFFIFYAPQVIKHYSIDRIDAARIFGDEDKYFSQI